MRDHLASRKLAPRPYHKQASDEHGRQKRGCAQSGQTRQSARAASPLVLVVGFALTPVALMVLTMMRCGVAVVA